MLRTVYKVLVVTISCVIVGFGIFTIYFLYVIGAFDTGYTPKELVENFNKKEKEIYSLMSYYNSIVPKDYFVEIEFENDNELGRFGVSTTKNNVQFLDWNLEINTPEMDAMLSTIGWNRVTLKTLKAKLDDANCISIESGEPSKIGFKRAGMGMYFFNVHDRPMTDSLRGVYKDDECAYRIVNDKLILEYGGGAIGPQCFPDE